MDKPPPKMATCSGLFLATIYNQSQLAERKHMARFLLINTAATAVPLSAQYNEISGGHIGRGGVVWRRCSAGPVLPLWCKARRCKFCKVGLRLVSMQRLNVVMWNCQGCFRRSTAGIHAGHLWEGRRQGHREERFYTHDTCKCREFLNSFDLCLLFYANSTLDWTLFGFS